MMKKLFAITLLLTASAWGQVATVQRPILSPEAPMCAADRADAQLWNPLGPDDPYPRSEVRLIAWPYVMGWLGDADCWFVANAVTGTHTVLPVPCSSYGPSALSATGVLGLNTSMQTAVLWHQAEGVVDLGSGAITGLSLDGGVGVGHYPVGVAAWQACWWSADHTRYDLPTMGGGGRALAVSGDGSTIYGFDRPAARGYVPYVGCRWADGELQLVPGLPQCDRIRIAGDWMLARPAGEAQYQLWHADQCVYAPLPRYWSGQSGYYDWRGVNADGVVCGAHHAGDEHAAVIWHADWPAPIVLTDLVPEAQLADWYSLDAAYAIEGDVVGGVGRDLEYVWRAFLLRLPETLP